MEFSHSHSRSIAGHAILPLLRRSVCLLCELEYRGHDAARSPIRFVWKLADRDALAASSDFKALLVACDELFT